MWVYSLRDFGSFRDAVFIPRASNKELSKIHLAFEREWQRYEVSVSIRLERQVISSVRPTDQRQSASISWHNFQRLRWLVSSVDAVLFSNSKFTASALGCSEETLFILLSKSVTGILRDRTCLEKDTTESSCLICDSSCCRTSCVSVQPCAPKVLPNTETFLHSWVFFVTCVVPALCQIMYSLSVCSDGTTSAPRSFHQNRPPARTLSLTEQTNVGNPYLGNAQFFIYFWIFSCPCLSFFLSKSNVVEHSVIPCYYHGLFRVLQKRLVETTDTVSAGSHCVWN